MRSPEMARQAVGRGLPFGVTVHAIAHGQIDVALGDGLLRDVAVARRALHLCADVRRVIELHVRRRRVAVHALPRKVESLARASRVIC